MSNAPITALTPPHLKTDTPKESGHARPAEPPGADCRTSNIVWPSSRVLLAPEPTSQTAASTPTSTTSRGDESLSPQLSWTAWLM
ncbi:hypothetical protein M433DRAFT_154660 [Acidomyces richmondensis BFW]|nr:MAG: hypothetical protein FE78DRAFT_90914 [Acidomyces sp. 'richmondensis']KYG45335.1 hypothetical protein M433DRAFT_154660 [Acidomyces richmondensis BFW]